MTKVSIAAQRMTTIRKATAIRLPTTSAQISVQTRPICCGHHRRAGLDAEDDEGAHQHRHARTAGNAEEQGGQQRAAFARVDAAFRRDHAFHRALAEALRRLRSLHGVAISEPGGGVAAEAGDHADHRADDRASGSPATSAWALPECLRIIAGRRISRLPSRPRRSSRRARRARSFPEWRRSRARR